MNEPNTSETVERKPELRITPTEHEKREWRRMATAAYDLDLNDIGHRCSPYGALRIGESIPIQAFDEMQTNYREWLINGFGKPSTRNQPPFLDSMFCYTTKNL